MATPEFSNHIPPQILAPAGNQDSFLAAVAAGADAIYCGLKKYSARMEAANFSLEQLAALAQLAHARGIKIHIALNTLLKPEEIRDSVTLLNQIRTHIRPDGLIIQDPGLIPLARQAGLGKRLHLSTLANVTFPKALVQLHKKWGIRRVVLPRELDIDEIRIMAAACPPGMDLEVFIHGALCYAVSGRCYWSSYLGGKSGLRGRCVQPCRRNYVSGSVKGRLFACLDLSLDVLVKVLKTIPEVGVWKIEGRKKGPHYVYHLVKAYRRLRDHGHDPKAKKEALALIEYALGRPGTHYRFLPQRPYLPIGDKTPSGSGLLVGRTKGALKAPFIQPRLALYLNDKLRIGYEDHPWHCVRRVNRGIPAKGRYHLNLPPGKKPPKGTPVFLIDRRDPALSKDINALASQLPPVAAIQSPRAKTIAKSRPHQKPRARRPIEMRVMRSAPSGAMRATWGLWLMDAAIESLSPKSIARIWWWLPPVIWPSDEKATVAKIEDVCIRGGRQFVLNAPWQTALFQSDKRSKGKIWWAGPFCNTGNGSAIAVLQKMGFKGVILSPELSETEYLNLPGQSPLPLGIVLTGNWPLGLSRISPAVPQPAKAFNSPQKELGWIRNYGSLQWLYPNWPVDLRPHHQRLLRAGYHMFVNLVEPIPRGIPIKKRPGFWNWHHGLP